MSILSGTKLFLTDVGDDSISANGGGNTIDASGSSGDVTIRGSASAADTILGGTGRGSSDSDCQRWSTVAVEQRDRW